jgi:hypothetical protein
MSARMRENKCTPILRLSVYVFKKNKYVRFYQRENDAHSLSVQPCVFRKKLYVCMRVCEKKLNTYTPLIMIIFTKISSA